VTPPVQARLVLGWTVALLQMGRVTEARAALAAYSGPRDAAYEVRVGLAAMAGGDLPGARSALERIELEQLPAGERAWYHYLRGLVADETGEASQASAAYASAMETAASELQRARFFLADLRSQLRHRAPTEAEATALARSVENNQGRATGFTAVKMYVAVLAALGRTNEAVTVLQRQLVTLPAQERAVQDDFRLLLGIIAGAADGVGRNALSNLLATGSSPMKQRAALQLIAQQLPGGATATTVRETWRAELGRLIELDPPHPILAELLLYRAQLALQDNRHGEAEVDAEALLTRFPGSPLRPQALTVLMQAGWERERFRAVANRATEARGLLPAGEARSRLAVLVAEAFFRAEDYRNAAEAYGASLNEVPPGVPPGRLMFQQVVSLIRAGDLDEAAARLDVLARRPTMDLLNRWQAEYNLAQAFQAAGTPEKAAGRIAALLTPAAGAEAVPAELLVRLSWLQARLALDMGQAERAIEVSRALSTRLSTIAPDLRSQVASLLALVEAEANIGLGRAEDGLDVLRRLRVEHPGTDAAIWSYIVEADAYSRNNRLVDAQRLLTRLADDFPDSRYAPYALYQAALNAERRGQDNFLEDAIRIIERLVRTYPQSDLVFYARFKQGDLLRKLNQFGSAVQIYELLTREHPRHRDVLAAELAKADCYAAQAATDVSQLESALSVYERLQIVPTAPVELRIEAGFKRGYALLRRGPVDRAQAAWWEVVNTFLLGEERRSALGDRGRYWLARTLLELARSFETAGRLEEARNAYRLMAQQELPGGNLAREALLRLTGVAPIETGR
jgi:cellulose synthase operon protein C